MGTVKFRDASMTAALGSESPALTESRTTSVRERLGTFAVSMKFVHALRRRERVANFFQQNW